MSSFSSRLRKVDLSKDRRRNDSSKTRVPVWLFLVFLACMCGMFLAGKIYGEKTNPQFMETNSSESFTVSADGYNITFLPETHEYMEGTVIGRNVYEGNHRFFIQTGLTKSSTETTCVHEKLHDLGIKGGESDGHDWLYMHDDNIEDYTCVKLLEKLEKKHYW